MGRETTHEIEGRVHFTTAKSRLVEDEFTGVKYWIPKKCTYDMNESTDDGLFIFVVNNWWYNKRADFEVQDEE